MHDERLPRGLWRLGRIQETFKGRDGLIRGVTIKMAKRDRHQDLLRRPIQWVYRLEVCYPNSEIEDTENSPGNVSQLELESKEGDEKKKRLGGVLNMPLHIKLMNAGRHQLQDI